MRRCHRCGGRFLPGDEIATLPTRVGEVGDPWTYHEDETTCTDLLADSDQWSYDTSTYGPRTPAAADEDDFSLDALLDQPA